VGIGENQTKNAIMYSQKEMGICEPLDLKLMEVFLQEKIAHAYAGRAACQGLNLIDPSKH
jgi:hypothetical protein